MGDDEHDELLALPHPLRPADALRGAVLASSLLGIRETGHEERYYELLDPAFVEAMRSVSAGTWVEMDAALAHYDAADRIGMSRTEVRGIGQRVGERLHKSVVGTIVRGLRAAGVVGPFSIYPRLNFLWARSVRGGGLRLLRLGPTEARLEVHAVPTVRHAFFRESLGGNLENTLRLFSPSTELAVEWIDGDTCAYRLSWV